MYFDSVSLFNLHCCHDSWERLLLLWKWRVSWLGDIQMSLFPLPKIWDSGNYFMKPYAICLTAMLTFFTLLDFSLILCPLWLWNKKMRNRRFLVATSTSWYMVLLWKASCTIISVNIAKKIISVNRTYKTERKTAQNFTSFQNAQLSAGTCISISTLSICCSLHLCPDGHPDFSISHWSLMCTVLVLCVAS